MANPETTQPFLWGLCSERLGLFVAAKRRHGRLATRIQQSEGVDKAVAKITRDERYIIQVLPSDGVWEEFEVNAEDLVRMDTDHLYAEYVR